MPLPAKLFLIASSMPLVAVLIPSCIVIGIGMVPTLVGHLFARRDRHFALCVGLANGCGVLPGLGDLWTSGHNVAAAWSVALDPQFWLFASSGAAVGWFIYMAMPPIIAVYYTIASDARIRHLMQRRKLLIETWGEEIDSGPAETAGAEPSDGAETQG
ncbi:MAG: hypothetical protein MI920_01445 [Kiloniellales bacterium]|nr:hypothetical protein [Kiloniellales bacterium]